MQTGSAGYSNGAIAGKSQKVRDPGVSEVKEPRGRTAVARAGCVASRDGCGADSGPVRVRKPAEESKYRQTRGEVQGADSNGTGRQIWRESSGPSWPGLTEFL